jgi:hypothetical protein
MAGVAAVVIALSAGCSGGDSADNGPMPPPPTAGQKVVDPAANPLNAMKHMKGQKKYEPGDLSKTLPAPADTSASK